MSEETKTIYVVTSGEYSGYGIVAMFDSKNMAELFVARFLADPGDYARIEEWTLNEHSGGLRRGESSWLAWFDERGVITDFEQSNDAPTDSGAHIHPTGPFKGRGYWRGWARNEEHALKIAQEQIMQAKARAEGMT
jgi:hypothetical protein